MKKYRLVILGFKGSHFDFSHLTELKKKILGSKKSVRFVSAIFHCPLCLMSTYLVPKSRSEYVHYTRDIKLLIPVSLGYVFVSRKCENESCKTTLKLAISTIHHFILPKLEIRCLL